MKKILILTRSLSSTAGVPKALISFLKNANLSNLEITFGIMQKSDELLDDFSKIGKVIFYNETPQILKLKKRRDAIKNKKIFFLYWKFLNQIEKILTKKSIKKEFGILYDNAIAFHQGDASIYLARYIKAKNKIFWCHSSTIMDDMFEKDFLKADKIVCVSQGAKDNLIQNFKKLDSNKIIVLPCYSDINSIILKSKEKNPLVDFKKPILLTVGRLSYEKGFDILLKTAVLLKEKFINFSWIIIGSGNQLNYIQNEIHKYKLEDCVFLLGSFENPYPAIANCDIYVSTSLKESYGLTISEALILNKKVVATKTMGALQQIEDQRNGFLCSFDPVDIKEKIIYALRTNIENQLSSKLINENNEKLALFEKLLKNNY